MVSITYLNSSSPPSDSGSIQSDTQSDAYNDSEGMLTELVAAPESSSTVVPSSPVIQTAPSVMRISPKPCQLRSVQRAAFPALGKAKLAAEDSDLDPLPEIVPNEGFTPKRSLAFENELSLPKSRSSRKSSHSSSGSSRYERHPSHSYYPMDTVESQLRFTRHLDKFLLRLLSQQQVGPLSRIRRSLSLSQSISQSPCDSGASATSSLYAADVSLAQSFGDSVVSSLSSSRSTSCSVSSAASLADIDAPSAYTQKSDNLSSSASPGYDIQTPMRFDAQLVYGSVSDGDEAEAAIDVDEGLPPIQPEARSVALAVNRLGTPLPSNDLKTPAAPKKTQHHFYPLVPNGLALPPRKRARFSKSDQPAQDHLKTGECMRNEPFSTGSSGERIAYSHRVSPVDTFIAVSCGDTASQGPISSQTVPDSQDIPLVPSLTGLLVCVPASFRRAASLRSDPSATKTIAFGDSGMERIAKPSPSPTSMTGAARTERNAATCPPTQPVTPATKMSTSKKSPTLSPFPVLSPSAFGSACRAPIYAADAAEARIKALVKRELADRRFDALLEGTIVFSEEAPPASVDSDTEMWRALGEDVSGGVLRLRDGDMHDDISENVDHYKTEDIPLFLGVEEDLRIKVVEWILDIMPPANLPKKNAFAHLRAQLTEAPDTRWHAAHLVTRYFFEIGTSEPPSPSTEPTSQHAGSPRVLQGREALTWDIGVACLALSVKFHRDFLHPLYPVVATDYLAISPHTMKYEDLEAAHRDVLSALNFCIGSSTPGAYVEELIVALPSLRLFVDAKGDWQFAHAETWEILFDTLVDVNYLRHPVCAITGCALVLGIAESIVYKRKTDVAIKARFAPESAYKRKRGVKCECDRLRAKALKTVQGVENDIRETLGISMVAWTNCMKWLKTLEG